jgi:hypothetical protein
MRGEQRIDGRHVFRDESDMRRKFRLGIGTEKPRRAKP